MFWTVHLEGGPKRVNHAAVLVGDKIYSFGGFSTGENYRNKRPIDVYILNTVSLRWTALEATQPGSKQLECSPYQRYGHTAVVHDSKIYVWGGRNDKRSCNTLFCFDTETHQWSVPRVTGTVPGARDGHSACVIKDSMYIFGGYEEYVDQFSQDVFALNLTTMHWTFLMTKGEPPSFRDFHTGTNLNGHMYVWGGRGDLSGPHHSRRELYCQDVLYLDTDSLTWYQPVAHGDVPIGRRSHSAFVHGGRLYVFGGYNSLFDEHFNDLHCYCPQRSQWQTVIPQGKVPSKRRRQACIVAGDQMFMFGGTSPREIREVQTFRVNDEDTEHMEFLGLEDHDDLHILDLRPSLRKLCLMAILSYKLETESLPGVLRCELLAMTTNNAIRPLMPNSYLATYPPSSQE